MLNFDCKNLIIKKKYQKYSLDKNAGISLNRTKIFSHT